MELKSLIPTRTKSLSRIREPRVLTQFFATRKSPAMNQAAGRLNPPGNALDCLSAWSSKVLLWGTILCLASTVEFLQAADKPSVGADREAAPLLVVDWAELKAAGKLKAGTLVKDPAGGKPRLKIVNVHETLGAWTLALVEIPTPPIKSPSYALRGKIAYQQVQGDGFLEMWSHFPNAGAYFTRTLGESGPMGKITGTSDWRAFELPFHTGGQVPAPEKLSVNLVLAGPGTVELTALELVPIPAIAFASGQAWWDEATCGQIGGVAGTLIGVLGGILGTLVGLGVARRLVQVICWGMVVTGAVTIGACVWAITQQQPLGVWLPLALTGGFLTATGGTSLAMIPYRYRQLELRRMTALDIV